MPQAGATATSAAAPAATPAAGSAAPMADNAAAPAQSGAGSMGDGAATAPAPAGAAEEDDEAAASLREHHRHHHNGGVTAFILLGLDTLGIDDGQREKVDAIRHELNASMAPAREAEKKLIVALAEGIAAGTVDSARVDHAVEKLTHAASGLHGETVEALNKLHAILNPAQRNELAFKVQAHWEVWRHVNHDMEEGGREKDGRLANLTRELELSDDQALRISTALHTESARHPKFDPREADEHVQAFAMAFASDTFDARKLGKGALANGHLAKHGATRMVRFYEAVEPVLTAAQRNKLADDLREHLTHQEPGASASNN